jgi:hypothetical protein
MLAPQGLTPLLSNIFVYLQPLMFGNTHTMLIIKTSELTMLSKFGKSSTGKMLKRDSSLLQEKNEWILMFHASYLSIFMQLIKLRNILKVFLQFVREFFSISIKFQIMWALTYLTRIQNLRSVSFNLMKL